MSAAYQMDTKISSTQAQVENITNIMQQNLQSVMERDYNLQNLEQSADRLNDHAGQFQATSSRTKRFFIWKNAKWTAILIVTIILILVVIALALGLGFGLSDKKN